MHAYCCILYACTTPVRSLSDASIDLDASTFSRYCITLHSRSCGRAVRAPEPATYTGTIKLTDVLTLHAGEPTDPTGRQQTSTGCYSPFSRCPPNRTRSRAHSHSHSRSHLHERVHFLELGEIPPLLRVRDDILSGDEVLRHTHVAYAVTSRDITLDHIAPQEHARCDARRRVDASLIESTARASPMIRVVGTTVHRW